MTEPIIQKQNVESFNLDHTKVKAPYIRLASKKVLNNGEILSKYDLRFAQPNKEHLPMQSVHSLEHMFAEHVRNHSDKVVDFSPMGCQTGFYLILLDEYDFAEVAKLVEKTLYDVLDAKVVPAANEIQCGWGNNHSLFGAQELARKFLEDKSEWHKVMIDDYEELDFQNSDVLGTCPAIIVAMQEEFEPFLKKSSYVHLTAEQQKSVTFKHGGAEFIKTVIKDKDGFYKDVILVASGIGLVNAGVAATLAIQEFGATSLITSGSAGGINGKVNICDVVVSTESLYSTADATAFTHYSLGQIPRMPEKYVATNELNFNSNNYPLVKGLIISADAFVHEKNFSDIVGKFPEAVATDMETAAIAQVAHKFDVPWVSIRAISDLCGPQANNDFQNHIDDAANIAAETVLSLF